MFRTENTIANGKIKAEIKRSGQILFYIIVEAPLEQIPLFT